jgi:hypothetical protein
MAKPLNQLGADVLKQVLEMNPIMIGFSSSSKGKIWFYYPHPEKPSVEDIVSKANRVLEKDKLVLTIMKMNLEAKKQQLIIHYGVGEAPVEPVEDKQVMVDVEETGVRPSTREVLQLVGKDIPIEVLTPQVEAILGRLYNAAYTDGFMAAKTPVRTHMF